MRVESGTKKKGEEEMKGGRKKTRVAGIINKGCSFKGEAFAALHCCPNGW